MKKTPSSNLHQSSQRRKNANFQDSTDTKNHNPKTYSALKSFKSAVKKCADVFALILTGKRKTDSKLIGNDDRKNTSKVRGVVLVSCKFD